MVFDFETNEEGKIKVFSYSTLDEKMYVYWLKENKIQLFAEQFTTEIWFILSDEDAAEYGEIEAPQDNLKEDFIYFNPTINGASWWQCTCGQFLETDHRGTDRMIKRVIAHCKRTGHVIMPRGN